MNFRVARGIDVPVGKLDVFIEATNAFDRSNVCCRDYDIEERPSGDIELVYSDEKWLPLLPAAGILWQF